MWKNLKIRKDRAAGNVRLFRMYEREMITFREMKDEFMQRNGIEYLQDSEFLAWLHGLGWKFEVRE